MNKEEFERLYLQSLEMPIERSQQLHLDEALATHRILQHSAHQFTTLRALFEPQEPSSFGPFFAERVTNYIKNLKNEVDYQLFAFFKKYQLAAIGIVVALVILNLFQSDQFSIASFLGFEEKAPLVEPIDFFTSITQ